MIRQPNEQAYEYHARMVDGSQWCTGCLYAVDRLHARIKVLEQLPQGAWRVHARPIQRRFWARLRTWPAARWTALASVVIALCALSISFQQGAAIREHQRLSVIPWMHFTFNYNEAGAGWFLTTKGLGPAILQTFEVLVNAKPQHHWTEVLEALGISGRIHYEFLVPTPINLYQSGTSDTILWILPGPAAEALKQKRDQVRIVACICSLYNECWRIMDKRERLRKQVQQCQTERDIMFTAPPINPTTP